MAKTIALIFTGIAVLAGQTYAFHESPEVLAAKPGVTEEAKAIRGDLDIGKAHPNIGGCKAAIAKNLRGEVFLNLIEAELDTDKKRQKLNLAETKYGGFQALAAYAAEAEKKRNVLADAYVPQAEWEVKMAEEAYQKARVREDALELLTHELGRASTNGSAKDVEFIGPCAEPPQSAH